MLLMLQILLFVDVVDVVDDGCAVLVLATEDRGARLPRLPRLPRHDVAVS